MRDGLGMVLVAVGLAWTLLSRDKLGLVVAFVGVTLLAYGILRPRLLGATDGRDPPIFRTRSGFYVLGATSRVSPDLVSRSA